MKKVTKKDKRRLIILVIILIPLFTFFVSNVISYSSQIYRNIKEKKKLEQAYNEVLDEEKELKQVIDRLNDPDYVAKYAREKYLYSKEGEIIIKLDD